MSHLTIPHRTLDIALQNGPDTFEITVRFSTSNPDLLLSIPAASNPTIATLKQSIRASLPEDLKNKRVRLIHAGKALDDAAPLSASLKRHVSRPPSRIPTPGPYETGTDTDASRSAKAKGKLPVRDQPSARVYIHCSIGDVTLSPEDLAAEVALASTTSDNEGEQGAGAQHNQNTSTNVTTTTPAPRGFDRLLNAGFSPAEINTLRLQFMSIQAHTHTPDSMPSPNTLRAMEDQWLDNSSSSLSLTQGDESQGGGMDVGDDSRGALDDMIWGTTIGFFWPIACLIWGVREEGIFSPRRKIAIVIGVVLNLGLGFVRWGG